MEPVIALILGSGVLAFSWFADSFYSDVDRLRIKAEHLWERRFMVPGMNPNLDRETWIQQQMVIDRRSWKWLLMPIFMLVGGLLLAYGLGGLLFGWTPA